MSISKKTWTGTAKESTPGTAITVPTLYHPTKTTFKGTKKREFLNEERGDRNANYGVVDSIRQSAIETNGPFYVDTSPVVMWAGMGLPSTASPTSGVYKHSFQLQDVPPSYTIVRSFDAVVYYVPYSVVEKFDISFQADGKLLEVKGSWVGMYAQKLSSPPTPTYSTVLPFAGYAPTITTSAGVSNDIIDMTISYAQKVALWYPANGSQDYLTAYFGERSFTVDFTARFDNDNLYQLFRTNTNDNLTLDVQGGNIVTMVALGSPSAGNFTLSYNGATTGNISYNAPSTAVATALQGLPTINSASNVAVSGSAGGPYTITFQGALAGTTNPLTGSGTGLTGGTFAVTSYNRELNYVFSNITYDTMEHDTSKDNVLIKAKATVLVPAGSTLVSGFVQNAVSSYTA